MKRSEMIKKLCEPLEIYDGAEFQLYKSEAEAILRRIEELGMSPPYCGASGDKSGEHVKNCLWEPENENSRQQHH